MNTHTEIAMIQPVRTVWSEEDSECREVSTLVGARMNSTQKLQIDNEKMFPSLS
jgi:hypothetical protein